MVFFLGGGRGEAAFIIDCNISVSNNAPSFGQVWIKTITMMMILTVVHPQSGWTLFSIVPNWVEIWKLGDENQRILIKPLGTHGTRTNEKLNPHITLETISIQRWQGRHGWKSKDYSFSLYWNCACSNPNSEKEKKFLCYLYMSFIKHKNELGIFTTKSSSGCKEKYKRLRCTCRVVTLLTIFLSSCGRHHHRILWSLIPSRVT